MCHIQTGHDDRYPRTEDNVRRFRIDQDIELGTGRPVATYHGSTHDGDLLDVCLTFRIDTQKGPEIGQRTGRNECDGF